jgi:HD-GYP domain-containing protein (c-di-GMP phosphodiesterase class II)
MGLQVRQIELIRKASLLHDLGKLGIPERILDKPDVLNSEEYDVMKMHPLYGARLLEKSSSLSSLVPVVKYHHEHYDGSGYPEGLRGSAITIEARIVAVADAIEAMASDRSYRKAISRVEIIEELNRNAGTQFDPHVVAAAVKLLEAGVISLNRLQVEENKVSHYTLAK